MNVGFGLRKMILAAAFLSGMLMAPAWAAPDWPIPPGVKTVEVNGYPLAYIEDGTGTPIVILHGMWVDHRLFTSQVAGFSKTHRAIAVSLRHYYPEPWDGKNGAFSISQQASDVVALIRQLNLGKVHLLGHSRGGAVAINVARQAPELMRTLILEEAAGLESLLADEAVGRNRIEGVTKLGSLVRSKLDSGGRPKAAESGWNAALGPGAWDRLPPNMQQMLVDNIGTVANGTYDPPAIGCDDIRKFTFPILLMQSERAGKVYADMFAAMRQCNPAIGAPTIVPAAGHNMHLDNRAFFNDSVLAYLQRN